MAEIRRDYFTPRVVIVSPERARRPSNFQSGPREAKVDPPECPFCPGNEEMTPPANLILVQREGALVKLGDGEEASDWMVRCFPNKYPALDDHPPQFFGEEPLYSEPGYGHHFVVAMRDHATGFAKMDLDQWINVLSAVQDRVKWLYSQKGVSYVVVFVNEGKEAGASIQHPHLQILSLPQMPPLLELEATSVQRSMNESGICPMCRVISREAGGPRQILATDTHLSFAPWASAHAYEFWIFPKRHQTSFIRLTQREVSDLALILRSTLGGMSDALGTPPYNLVFHLSPEKKTTRQLHWHVEVYPQLVKWAGLERGTGVYVNPVPPESAAEVLGSASRREFGSLMGVR